MDKIRLPCTHCDREVKGSRAGRARVPVLLHFFLSLQISGMLTPKPWFPFTYNRNNKVVTGKDSRRAWTVQVKIPIKTLPYTLYLNVLGAFLWFLLKRFWGSDRLAAFLLPLRGHLNF